MKAAIGLHHARRLATAQAAFREARGEAGYQRRAAEIAALPTREWKGETLHTLRCNGETGRGPHDVHLSEAVLWALINLRGYRCPFHV